MATYDPPLQTLPIFDSSVFINGADGLSTTEADARYLRFPQSQGSETINGDLSVSGALTAGTFAPTAISCNTYTTTTTANNASLFGEASRGGNINIGLGADRTGNINLGNGSGINTGAINLLTNGSGTTTIGNASSTNTLLGTTNINSTGSSVTSIGNLTGALNLTGVPVSLGTLAGGSYVGIQTDVRVIQDTYPSTITTQLGYTIQKTFGPTNASDTAGTYSNIGSQLLPASKGVYIITCGFTITASGNDTLESVSVLLSLTSGTSSTEVNAYGAWRFFTETNDVMGGGGGLRYVGMLGGTYINTVGTAATLYLNAYAPTTGAITMSVQGNCSITRIG